eukprot:CAMPEP_0206502262 /NCGR_PEP_ID=MMETSP0324_2-20121206/53884_1 /ASSEMBLY_ACC=CAM_ASM_000836 /TAXON_ID=2866 /ORGANISM="Crypthecodinium cohnii, Strain Seligo" /LENGTH=494 /DNA_ID=CAMNT_0053990405 /DNA_START=6 /DNA_END=1490 /DNA_ORIENTATION=+
MTHHLEISPADTGFMIMCAGLVQLMTPGLAFFYGGLVRHHNSIAMMSQNFVSLAVTSVVWVIFLFSLCFGESWDPWGIIGNPTTFAFFQTVGMHEPLTNGTSGGTTARIPGLLFGFYQCMFAVITPALMTGAFADRMRYKAWLLFLILWLMLVYAPWCHMVWGGGLFAKMGVQDFAGGIVVHTTAGFSCNAILLVLGRRAVLPGGEEDMDIPHSVPLTFLGTALLWFGWFGFNCGSALSANSVAATAGWNSQVSAAAAMMSWTIIDWFVKGKPGLVGKCVGCIAGLATVTPAAGFIQPWGALIVGLVAAPSCYACVLLSKRLGFDDALDVWGVHGMGGALGTILLGVLADGAECADAATAPEWCVNPGTVVRSPKQFGIQVMAAVLCAFHSFVMSYLLLKLIGLGFTLTYTAEEQHAIDTFEHGEVGYYHVTAEIRESSSPRAVSLEKASPPPPSEQLAPEDLDVETTDAYESTEESESIAWATKKKGGGCVMM